MITISKALFITLIVFSSITALELLLCLVGTIMYIIDRIRVNKMIERNTEDENKCIEKRN